MSDRSERIKELAETWSEKFLAWQIALPKPWTAVLVIAQAVLGALGWLV